MQGIHSYELIIETVEGAPPFDYDTLSGNPPPAGLNLDPVTGVLSGIPTTPGIFPFTVVSVDSNFCKVSTLYTLIGSPTDCPTITLPLDDWVVWEEGTFYSQPLVASSGVEPYVYFVTAGSPPPGLAHDPETGFISGYPAVEGVLKFAVTVQDANGCYGTRSYGVEVVCTLDVTITSPPEISGIVLACNSITASGAQVVDPGATFVAGIFLILGDGFSVGPETVFTAIIDPSLVP
jgi:hypothetical protein